MAATPDKEIFIERFLRRVNRFFGPVPKGPHSDGEYPKTFDRVSVCYIHTVGASPRCDVYAEGFTKAFP